MTLVIVAVAVIGTLSLKSEPETIQGQIEVAEYRVSSKVPGRILELRVKEGDYVNVGDTLAILDAPDVRAKMTQAESAENAAAAMDEMANNGARKEQVRAAFAVLQQAKAGLEIAEKSYNRVQRLFDEGVVTAQKRDEAFANYKALEAQVKAAQSQYDMALNGARMEEKKAAAAQVNRAKGAVAEVSSSCPRSRTPWGLQMLLYSRATWLGTKSMMTFSPASWVRLTRARNSSMRRATSSARSGSMS